MVDYTGPERRKEIEPGRLGRRSQDWHCGEHALVQVVTKDHRAMVCGKITTMQVELNKMVSWRVFAFITTFAVLIIGSGFGFFSLHLEKLGDRHYKGMNEIRESLHNIEKTQESMTVKIVAIQERQDVLRDAHMRDMQRQ